MALKYKLDSLDGLDDASKALYEASGDKFILKLDGFEEGDTAGLRKQLETLLGENKALKKDNLDRTKREKDAAEAARKAADEAAAKSGDIEAVRRSSEERVTQVIAEQEGKWKPQVDKLNAAMRSLLVDRVASGIATKIGLKGSEHILTPFIAKRLDVEEHNGEYITVVRDAKGNASALTVTDLEKEFAGDAAFAPIIAGSKAVGSGAPAGQNKGAGGTGAKSVTRAEYDAMSDAARYAHATGGGTITDT